MATLTDVRDDIYTIVSAQLPALTRQYDMGQIMRINWRKLVEEGDQGGSGPSLTPPYLVIRWGKQRPANWGVTNIAYEIMVDFHYVTSLDIYAGDSSDNDDKGVEVLMAEIEAALEALVTGLEGYNQAAGGKFTYLESELDTSELNPINAYFYDANMRMLAGILTARLVFGRNG